MTPEGKILKAKFQKFSGLQPGPLCVRGLPHPALTPLAVSGGTRNAVLGPRRSCRAPLEGYGAHLCFSKNKLLAPPLMNYSCKLLNFPFRLHTLIWTHFLVGLHALVEMERWKTFMFIDVTVCHAIECGATQRTWTATSRHLANDRVMCCFVVADRARPCAWVPRERPRTALRRRDRHSARVHATSPGMSAAILAPSNRLIAPTWHLIIE